MNVVADYLSAYSLYWNRITVNVLLL